MDVASVDDHQRLRHLVAMYSVVNATNEAILHAPTPQVLYEQVCHAVVDGGIFTSMAIALPELDRSLKVVATDGISLDTLLGDIGLSYDPADARGQGLAGHAFRDGASCVSNDLMADERLRPWWSLVQSNGFASGAAVPMLHGESVIGVMVFYSAKKNTFGSETIKFIERMAYNMSVALNNFAMEEERATAELQLRESEAKYRGILETIEDAYYEVDLRGEIVHVNNAFCRLLGYEQYELRGRNYRHFETMEMADSIGQTFRHVYETGIPSIGYDWSMVRKDGQSVMCEGSIKLIVDVTGKPSGFRGMLRDVTKRRSMERALRESEARFRALTNLSTDWYWEQDAEFRYVRMESRRADVSATQRLFLGRRPWETELEIQSPLGWEGHRALLAKRAPFRDVIMFRLLSNGRPFYVSVSGEAIVDNDGELRGYRGVSKEITEQKMAEERIQFLATHDALTQLPNRVMFSEMLNQAIAVSQRNDRKFSVVFIDLDRFKYVNDTLGHEAGDLLLQTISARFREALRASDLLARLGGDEFVVLLPDAGNEDNAAEVARKILAAALQPLILFGQECRVTASIGVALYPEHGADEQTLMKNADIAMYAAKEDGKNNFKFYSDDIRSHSLERLGLEANLRHAIARGEFSLAYQAKLGLQHGTITGVEALLRWNSRELGSVPPNVFIPVAEETGMIVQIGRWVLRTACEQNMAWQREGLPPVCVAINLSARQFADDDLLTDITAVLDGTGMDAHLLEIEITESMVVNNPQRAIAMLNQIKSMGVRLAIDDFGAGYSALGQLKNFPIDTLKVDRSFICDIATNIEDKAITKAIIDIGKTLSLTVVAEGVETLEQQNFLREHACDEMQGYYFSKPVAAVEFAALLRQNSRLFCTEARKSASDIIE